MRPLPRIRRTVVAPQPGALYCCAAQQRDAQGFAREGAALPNPPVGAAPSRGPGPGCAGLRPASAMGYKGAPGRALPSQTLPPGGMGQPGFPIPLLKRQSVATKVTAPSPALPRWGRESGSSPQRGEVGRGAGAPHALRWKGLALVAYFHLSRPCGSAAQRRNEHKVLSGRASPSQTLPRVGAWGNPVSPFPCGVGAWGNPVSPFPCSSSLCSR